MHPVLFNIGNLTIFSYGFMLMLGFLLANLTISELAKRKSIKNDKITDLTLWILVCSVLGARMVFIATEWEYYFQNPIEIFKLNKGGLVYYGGLLGGILGAVLYLRKEKLPILGVGDMIVTALPLGQMFGRVGCFLNGCCFGKPTLSPLRITFPLESPANRFFQELTPVHPVQMYDSMAMGVLFLIMMSFYDHKKYSGQMIIVYCIAYGLIRFSLEFLRGDVPLIYYSLTLSQIISIGLVICGVVLWVFFTKRIKSL